MIQSNLRRESRSAGEGTRPPRSSSSEILVKKRESQKRERKAKSWNMECKNNEETGKIDECDWRNEESGSERFGIIRGQVESCMSEGVRVIYTGGEESKNGIAILLDEKVARCLDGVERYGDRLIMVTIRAHPVNIVIMQVYNGT